MFKLNNISKIGLVLFLISILLIFTPFLDLPIRLITHPILMGSSKGKDILLFLIMGVFLLLSNFNNNEVNTRRNLCINFVLVIFIILSIIGVFSEVFLRLNLGIDIFTIFNAMKPNLTSTSILHSHIYKAVFGDLVVHLIPNIPSSIHTGASLLPYIPFYIKGLFVLIPISMIIMLKALQGKDFYSKIFISIAFTISIIGLIDGGLFSTPFIGGIYLLLLMKYDSPTVSYWLSKKTKIENLGEIGKKENVVKKINEYRKILIFAIPHIILIIIIILRFTIAFSGSDISAYEVDIVNLDENTSLSNYTIIKTIEMDNHTTYYLSSQYNEMDLENSLNKELEGKCSYYSLTWNADSYFS